jgi:ATP-binding cassette subfamily C (CFTR/MRP) protein 1
MPSLSGALFSTIPLLVGIFTFIAYIALGNSLEVATALTSLALFDILRFPLFMLPNVLNNLVEAKVSVDRVQVLCACILYVCMYVLLLCVL